MQKTVNKPAAVVPTSTTRKWPSGHEFIMNILNGMAIGTIVALIPGALVGSIFKILLPYAPFLKPLLVATTLSNAAMGPIIGVMIGMFFKFTPIQSTSIGLAVFVGGGVLKGVGEGGKGLILSGTGDIINMGLTATIAVLLTLWLGDKLKAYAILLMPTLAVLVAGGIGMLTYPYVTQITHAIGVGVNALTTLQPVLMGLLIAMVFCVLIVSPITTVGIALAISLAGIGSAASNVGVAVCGFGFAIAGWKVNSHGTSIAHVLGSPKMSMANFLTKPKIVLPMLCASAVSGAAAALMGMQGTKTTGGFGLAGFVGPLTNLDVQGWDALNIVFTLLSFFVIPFVSAYFFLWLFEKKLHIVSPEDYRVVAQ